MPGSVFLENEHVSLRPAEPEDIDFIKSNENNRDVRSSRSRVTPSGDDWAQKHIGGTMGRNGDTVCLLVCVEEQPVGLVYLLREQPNDQQYNKGELAYWITPKQWNNGYATHTAELIIEYAFAELGLHRLTATVFDTNMASKRVLESVGFKEEGVLRKQVFTNGEWVDKIQYGLLANEWSL